MSSPLCVCVWSNLFKSRCYSCGIAFCSWCLIRHSWKIVFSQLLRTFCKIRNWQFSTDKFFSHSHSFPGKQMDHSGQAPNIDPLLWNNMKRVLMDSCPAHGWQRCRHKSFLETSPLGRLLNLGLSVNWDSNVSRMLVTDMLWCEAGLIISL